jgi:hypothetical protein
VLLLVCTNRWWYLLLQLGVDWHMVWETLHHLLLAETRRVGDGYLIKQQRIIRKKVKFGGPEINSTTPA